MIPQRRLIPLFTAGLLAVGLAMGWVTWQALELERRERHARAESQQQENIRLALWRMDSMLTAILARESARPYFEFQPFYSNQRAYTAMFEPVQPGEVLVPSPLLNGGDDLVRLYFQLSPDGTLTSPQNPTGNMRDLAESVPYVAPALIIQAEERLGRLASMGIAGKVAEPATARLGLRFQRGQSAPALTDEITRADLHRDRAVSAPSELAANTRSEAQPQTQPQSQPDAQTTLEAPPAPQTAQGPDAQGQVAQKFEDYAARQRQAELSNQTQRKLAPPQFARLPGSPNDSRAAGRGAAAEPNKQIAAAPPTAITPQTDKYKSEAQADKKRTTDGLKTGLPDPNPIAPNPLAKETNKDLAEQTAATADTATKADDAAKNQTNQQFDQQPYADSTSPTGGAALKPLDSSLSSTTGRRGGGEPNLPGVSITELEQGPFHAFWLQPSSLRAGQPPRTPPTQPDTGPELLLVRRVLVQNQELHQGLWVDWPALRARLIATSADLVPRARLEPLSSVNAQSPPAPEEVGRLLATIPARLITSPAPVFADPMWTPRRATLMASWIAVLGAGAIVILVLRASMALSERRGRFVSAVTHELRTPLTTFCLYSQMLADGMVTDEDARREYLVTLKSESKRLARVVEDVLDYARLARPKPRRAAATIPASDLLAHCLPELQRRADRAGMTLLQDFNIPAGAACSADPRTAERILLNLIDNACKYAAGPDRRLHLLATADDTKLRIHVADHGPGIPAADTARLFEPFERGRSTEHQSEPGLGLGLSISRGLARELGGDLRLLDPTTTFNTIFELTLPLTPRRTYLKSPERRPLPRRAATSP